MVAVGNGIPVTRKRFMEKKPWHIAQGKYQDQKYRPISFYRVIQLQRPNLALR